MIYQRNKHSKECKQRINRVYKGTKEERESKDKRESREREGKREREGTGNKEPGKQRREEQSRI